MARPVSWGRWSPGWKQRLPRGGHGSGCRDGDWEEVHGGGDREMESRVCPYRVGHVWEELPERGARHSVADFWGRLQGFAQ